MLAVGEQATVTDRGVRRVDPGHTRTVCSGYHRGPFFHVSSESSHNTSKVTKAKGKQIRGRALTGLSNTRAARRWSLRTTLLKVTTKKKKTTREDLSRTTTTTTTTTWWTVASSSSWIRGGVPTFSLIREERSSPLLITHETDRRWSETNEGGVKQAARQTFFPFVKHRRRTFLDPCIRLSTFHAFTLFTLSRHLRIYRYRSSVYNRYV